MKKDSEKSLVLMLAVVTGQAASETDVKGLGKYLKMKTSSPVKTYDLMRDEKLLNKGDFSGVTTDKTPKTRTEYKWVQTRAAYWESAGRDMCDNWVDGHMESAEGYDEPYEVFDGYNETTVITTSKRADIRQEKGALFLALETINEAALQKSYEAALKKNPVKDILAAVVGTEKTESLTAVFEAVASIKPLNLEDSLDPAKVKTLQEKHAAAVNGVKAAVRRSGLADFLGHDETSALVKRACGLTIAV